MARCQHNFNSGIHTGGKTRMAPKPRLPLHDGWHRTRELLKCQIGAAFAVEMWAQRGQMTNTAWKNTSTVASLPVARLGWLPSQAKLPLHDGWHRTPKMPLIIKCQINSQLKPDLPQHKPGSPWENWSLPTTSQLHLVCTTLSLLRTILDPVAVPKLWFLCSCLCCRDLGSIANKDSLEEHLWHVASILASGKTRMAPKTNKSNVHVGWHRTRKLCQWP